MTRPVIVKVKKISNDQELIQSDTISERSVLVLNVCFRIQHLYIIANFSVSLKHVPFCRYDLFVNRSGFF